MNYINTEFEKLQRDLRVQNRLFIAMLVLMLILSFLSYKLGKNKAEIENEKFDYHIELKQFDSIQVKTKTGEIHNISLFELQDLIIANEI